MTTHWCPGKMVVQKKKLKKKKTLVSASMCTQDQEAWGMNVSEIRMLREPSQALFGAKCQIKASTLAMGKI